MNGIFFGTVVLYTVCSHLIIDKKISCNVSLTIVFITLTIPHTPSYDIL